MTRGRFSEVLIGAFQACFLLFLTLCEADSSASTQRGEQLLKDCFQTSTENGSAPATLQDFLTGKPPRLLVHTALWSGKLQKDPRISGSREDIARLTVVTAATLNRLSTLEAQCLSWPGLLSAAVYVPVPVDPSVPEIHLAKLPLLIQAAQNVSALFLRTESLPLVCSLRVMLVYELVQAGDIIEHLLPVNTLRNMAMLGADTPLVAMIDVDLMLSASLWKEMTHATRLINSGAELQKICQLGTVFVLPAFETAKALPMEDGEALAEQLAKGSKEDLVGQVQKQAILPFAAKVYWRGHNATAYPHWYSSIEPYQVAYQANYEPWFIVARNLSLPYDERFRGYGWNKVAQVAHTAASGINFMVHPTAFVIHKPHARSGAQTVYDSISKRSSATPQAVAGKGNALTGGRKVAPAKLVHRKVAAMRHNVLRDLKKGVFEPVLSPEMKRCLAGLRWWHF